MAKEKLIRIVVEGGCVQDVVGLPKGYLYEIDDHDEPNGDVNVIVMETMMSEKKTFRIPVVWAVMGFVNVEAENVEEACHQVIGNGDLADGLPENGLYLDDSFGIDREGLEEYETNDPQNNLDALPQEYWR